MSESDWIKTQLRLPADLQALLVSAAEESGRSMNGEIVRRLSDSFPSLEYALLRNRQAELTMIGKVMEAQAEVVEQLRAALGRAGDDVERNDLKTREALAVGKLQWLDSLLSQVQQDVEFIQRAAKATLEASDAARKSKRRKTSK